MGSNSIWEFLVSVAGEIIMAIQQRNQVKSSIGLSLPQICTSGLEETGQGSSIYDLGFEVLDDNSTIDERQETNRVNDTGYRIKVAHGGSHNEIEKYSDKVNHQVGGGLREAITSFTRSSKNNLMRNIRSLDSTLLKHTDTLFITLTYDGNTEKNMWITGAEYKRHLKNITTAIQRAYGGFGVWRFELQKRLVGHFHLVWFKASGYIPHTWLASRWNEITEGSKEHLQAGTQIQRAKSWKGVLIYGCKVLGYIAKDDSTEKQREHMAKIQMGRCWGISGRQEFYSFVRMLGKELTEEMHTLLLRCYKKMQKSWKRQTENYKGWASLRNWMRSWNKLHNLTINMLMNNEVIAKLLKWVLSEIEPETNFQKMKRKSKSSRNKLDTWRMHNGYGAYSYS